MSNERSLMNGHEALSVFGIVDGEEAALIKPVARALLLRDALRANDYRRAGIRAGRAGDPEGRGERVSLVLPPKRERRRRGERGAPIRSAIRCSRRCARKRRELAQEAQVPPYVIFHDSVLREMATVRPATLTALSRISGVGARKLEAYGDAFLQVIGDA